MISYLAILALAFMAFTASAQETGIDYVFSVYDQLDCHIDASPPQSFELSESVCETLNVDGEFIPQAVIASIYGNDSDFCYVWSYQAGNTNACTWPAPWNVPTNGLCQAIPMGVTPPWEVRCGPWSWIRKHLFLFYFWIFGSLTWAYY